VVTAVVAVVIAVVKFVDGAWMVLLAVPILVAILVRVNRTYEAEERELLEGLQQISRDPAPPHAAIVIVDAVDSKTLHALQYAFTVQPGRVEAMHVVSGSGQAEALRAEWSARGLPGHLILASCPDGDRRSCLVEHVRGVASQGRDVTVVVPGPARLGWWERARRGQSWTGVVEAFRVMDNVSVVVVRDHGGPGHGRSEEGRLRVTPRPRHVAVILVDRLDQSVVKAIRTARAVNALEVRALHLAVDRAHAQELMQQWATWIHVLGVPLDVEDCPDRNVSRSVRRSIRELEGSDTEITVVMPRRDHPSIFQRLLHDRTSRTIARALADEPHVDVLMVPYRLAGHRYSSVASSR
jgi:hypothetical protein